MVGIPTVDQHWPNVGMMLALCPQHWPDVGAGGHWYVGPTSHQWLADGWPNIGPSSAQHWHVYGGLDVLHTIDNYNVVGDRISRRQCIGTHSTFTKVFQISVWCP